MSTACKENLFLEKYTTGYLLRHAFTEGCGFQCRFHDALLLEVCIHHQTKCIFNIPKVVSKVNNHLHFSGLIDYNMLLAVSPVLLIETGGGALSTTGKDPESRAVLPDNLRPTLDNMLALCFHVYCISCDYKWHGTS